MALDDNRRTELAKPLNLRNVAQRKQAGMTLDYIEGWWAIAEANAIFDFDGWSSEVLEMKMSREPERIKNDKGTEQWHMGYQATVRVHALGIYHDGIGWGSGINKDQGQAIESAIKEAETDALKRALIKYGWRFGLALYDKEKAHVVDSRFASEEPKAETRAEWQALVDRIRAAKSLSELKTIWEKEVMPEWATFDQKWQEEITAEKDTRRKALKSPAVKNGFRAPDDEPHPMEQVK